MRNLTHSEHHQISKDFLMTQLGLTIAGLGMLWEISTRFKKLNCNHHQISIGSTLNIYNNITNIYKNDIRIRERSRIYKQHSKAGVGSQSSNECNDTLYGIKQCIQELLCTLFNGS